MQPKLLIRQALANARTIADSNADEKIIKGGASGRARTARDDTAVTCLLAVSEGVSLGGTVTKRRWALAG